MARVFLLSYVTCTCTLPMLRSLCLLGLHGSAFHALPLGPPFRRGFLTGIMFYFPTSYCAHISRCFPSPLLRVSFFSVVLSPQKDDENQVDLIKASAQKQANRVIAAPRPKVIFL